MGLKPFEVCDLLACEKGQQHRCHLFGSHMSCWCFSNGKDVVSEPCRCWHFVSQEWSSSLSLSLSYKSFKPLVDGDAVQRRLELAKLSSWLPFITFMWRADRQAEGWVCIRRVFTHTFISWVFVNKIASVLSMSSTNAWSICCVNLHRCEFGTSSIGSRTKDSSR